MLPWMVWLPILFLISGAAIVIVILHFLLMEKRSISLPIVLAALPVPAVQALLRLLTAAPSLNIHLLAAICWLLLSIRQAALKEIIVSMYILTRLPAL